MVKVLHIKQWVSLFMKKNEPFIYKLKTAMLKNT